MKKIFLSLLVVAAFLSCSQKPFVVVQVADPQLGFDADVKSQKPGAVYVDDLSYETGYLQKAVIEINRIKPDAVVFTGDNVHRSNNEHQWGSFIQLVSRIDPEIKVLFVPGNHDVIETGSGVNMAPYVVYLGHDKFVHEDRGVKLVGINTNYIKFDDEREREQLDWLKTVLPKKKDSEFTLVFGHHPFFKEDIDEENGSQIQKDKRYTYFDLFKSAGVNAVYAGHLHAIREGEYEGIPMKSMTSVAYQLGEAEPSIRVITVSKNGIADEIRLL